MTPNEIKAIEARVEQALEISWLEHPMVVCQILASDIPAMIKSIRELKYKLRTERTNKVGVL